MKFGKLENIDHVDWTFPIEHELSNLQKDPVEGHLLNLFTGATSWNNKEWKGILYPEKARQKDFLSFYSKQFNSIELNSTHYRIPTEKSVRSWIEETPDDFKFCPKVLQRISHRKNPMDDKSLIDQFCDTLAILEDKIGCFFIQLPPYFKYDHLQALDHFLAYWPNELPLAVEQRNLQINTDPIKFERYIEILHKHNCYPVITDVAGRRDMMQIVLNRRKLFIRWVGNGLHQSDFERIGDWLEFLKTCSKRGLDSVFLMLHEPDNFDTPKIASYIKEQLANNQYISHRGPTILENPPQLFG